MIFIVFSAKFFKPFLRRKIDPIPLWNDSNFGAWVIEELPAMFSLRLSSKIRIIPSNLISKEKKKVDILLKLEQ
jgi:hypothetical protein